MIKDRYNLFFKKSREVRIREASLLNDYSLTFNRNTLIHKLYYKKV